VTAPRAVLLLAVAGWLVSCRERAQVPQETAGARPGLAIDADRAKALGLEVAPAARGDLPDVAIRFGRVQARAGDETIVVAPVAARVDRPPAVALGERVRAGSPLVTLAPLLGAGERLSFGVQSAELEGQIAGVEKDLAADEARLERDRALAKDQIVSTERLQKTEAEVAGARARLEALRRARAVQAPGGGPRLDVRSPADGLVAAIDAPVGRGVQAGDVLARILRPGPRWVDVAVPPADPVGAAYEIASLDGSFVSARLVARGAIVGDDGARHDRLEVVADAAAKVMPGATVAVRVAAGSSVGIVVPESAIVPGREGDRVFVADKDGRYLARSVKVAARFGGRARIAGVEEGERVVVRGAMALAGEELRGVLGEGAEE
jgi:RND family efflux transporter MFP subunit